MDRKRQIEIMDRAAARRGSPLAGWEQDRRLVALLERDPRDVARDANADTREQKP